MAIRRRISQKRRRETFIRQFRNRFLRFDLRFRVSRQRIERIALIQIELSALPIDRAGAGEEKSRHAGLLGQLRQANRGIAIDIERKLRVDGAHRIVGDRGQVHHAVVPLQIVHRDLPHIFYEVLVRLDHRLPVTSGKQIDIAAGHAMSGLLEHIDQMRADVTLVSSDKNFHIAHPLEN